MAGESNQVKWIGIRPTNPAENIPVDIKISTVDVSIKPSASPFVHAVQPGAWAPDYQGVTRTQILINGTANNNLIIVYTVTAGKSFYLTAASFNLFHTAAATMVLAVRDAADTHMGYLFYAQIAGSFSVCNSLSYSMPIVCGSGWDVCLRAIVGQASVCIAGWEQ